MNIEDTNTNIAKEERRLRFLTDFSPFDAGRSLESSEFFAYVEGFLDKAKVARLESIFVNETAQLIGACKRELFRVFFGSPKVDSFSFDNENNEIAFEGFRKNTLKDWDYMKTQIFEAIFDAPSSVLILFPKIIEGGGVEYLPKLIPTQAVKKSTHQNGKLTGLLFEYNEEAFLYSMDSIQIGKIEGGNFIPTQDITTGKMFARYIAPQYGNNPNHRKGVLSSLISSLSYLNYFINAINYADQYGAFPNMAVYTEKCSYRNESGVCNDGYIGDTICPSCSTRKSRYLGPGNLLEVDPPADNEDPDLLEAIKIFGGDTSNLEYLTGKAKEREKALFYSIVGITESSKAYNNEEYIKATLESRETILQKLASILEESHFWILDTLAAEIYGGDYKGGVLSYGSKFFKSESDKRATQRQKLLSEIVPFWDLSEEQTLALNGIASPQDILFRLNWAFWIARFERANSTSIEDFGKLSDLSDKGGRIYDDIIKLITPPTPENNAEM